MKIKQRANGKTGAKKRKNYKGGKKSEMDGPKDDRMLEGIRAMSLACNKRAKQETPSEVIALASQQEKKKKLASPVTKRESCRSAESNSQLPFRPKQDIALVHYEPVTARPPTLFFLSDRSVRVMFVRSPFDVFSTLVSVAFSLAFFYSQSTL